MGVTAVAANTRIRARDQILSGSAGPEVPSTVIASGGTVTISGSVVTHTFSANGNFLVYQGGYVTVTPSGGGSSSATTGTLAVGNYTITAGGGSVTFQYSTDGLLSGLYATGGTIAVNGNNIEHTFSSGGNFTLAKKGQINVSWTISATGTFDGSGSSGGPANKNATCAVTVTSGTVVVTYPPGAFEPGNPMGWYSTTMEAYFDPLTGVTDAGAGAVSAWNDQSSHASNYSQGTGGNRPTTGTQTSPTGLNVIDFDGSNDYMDQGSNAIVVAGKKVTVFAVAKWDATGTGKCPLSAVNTVPSNSLQTMQWEINTTNPQISWGTGASVFSTPNFNERVYSSPGSWTNWHWHILTIDSTDTWHVYVDDASSERSTSGGTGGGTMTAANFLSSSTTAWKLTCGRRPDPFYFDGKLGPHGVLSEVLSSGDRTLLANWMKAKWTG